MMNLKQIGLPVAVLFFFVNALTASGQQEQQLQWDLQQDQQFDVTLVQSSSSTTQVDSRETQIESSTTIVLNWTVTSVDASGDFQIEQSMKSVKLSVGDPAVPAQAIRYDTASNGKISSESRKLMKQIKPLLELKFNVVMSPRGEIKAVTLPTETSDQLNRLPETQKLRELFSESGLKDLLGASAMVLPADPLSAGKTWTEESKTVTPQGEFNRIRTYTFDGIESEDQGEFAKFSLVTTMKPATTSGDRTSESQSEIKDASGKSLNGKLVSFSGTGELKMDAKEGFFVSSDIRNEAVTEKPYREKTITTTVLNQIQMTVTKK